MSDIEQQEHYMRLALALAREAGGHGEVPVGCVIVSDGAVIACGRNRREENADALGHAEIEAIGAACRALGTWRLERCALYVTLEPCPMCAGAILNARVGQVFYGARDSKMGACGGVFDLFFENFNHRPQIVGGVLETECAVLMKAFFASLRGEQKS